MKTTREVFYTEYEKGKIRLIVAFPEFDAQGRAEGDLVDVWEEVVQSEVNARGAEYLRELISKMAARAGMDLVPSQALRNLGV